MPKKYHNINDLKIHASNLGGKCLSTTYKNNSTKYEWECSKGHRWEANWNNVLSKGNWCKRCSSATSAQKYTIEDLHKFALSKKGECLSNIYEKDKSKYRWKCLKHDFIWEASWNCVNRGSWCPKCKADKISKISKLYDISDLKDYAKSKGGECISNEYINTTSKYEFKCAKGHKWETSWSNLIYANSWCPECDRAKVSSASEKELLEFCSTLEEVEASNRSILKGKELDIVFTNKKVAIEFHGLYWHSEAVVPVSEAKTMHLNKYLLAKEQNYSLIQIFEDEWKSKRDIIESIVRNKTGNILHKFNARDCVVKEVETKERREFFNKNHISGDVRSSYCLGLYFKNDLICALSVRKPFTRKHKNCLEIARFASTLNSSVRGGFSKLFKYIKLYAKKEGYKRIISYADLRFGEGKVYESNGLTFKYRTKPNYFYQKSGKRENRFKYRKINDLEYIRQYGNTEREQNNNQGRFAIYDVGSNLYAMEL